MMFNDNRLKDIEPARLTGVTKVIPIKVKKKTKNRNRYNQEPHL